MGNLGYLLAALGVIVFGLCMIALRNRAPRGVDSAIRAHQRHMDALSNDRLRQQPVSPPPDPGLGE